MLISVVICVYNAEPFLRHCLESLINQSYCDLDIIIVYDKSKDESLDTCKKYAMQDSRVQILINHEKKGIGYARNEGIKAAKGEWITFLDSDDWLDIDYYEKMVRVLENSEADFIISGGYYVERNGKNNTVFGIGEKIFCDTRSINNISISAIEGIIPCAKNKSFSLNVVWVHFFRNSFIKKYDISFRSDLKHMEDNMFLQFAFQKASYIESCNVIGYHYRVNEYSATNNFYYALIDDLLYSFNAFYNYCESLFKEQDILYVLKKRKLLFLIRIAGQYYFHKNNTKKYIFRRRQFLHLCNSQRFKESVYDKDLPNLSRKQKLLKCLFKLSITIPLEIYYKYFRFNLKRIINK